MQRLDGMIMVALTLSIGVYVIGLTGPALEEVPVPVVGCSNIGNCAVVLVPYLDGVAIIMGAVVLLGILLYYFPSPPYMSREQ